ncbi:putative reverse transcriptase domain-containing protein, partial [Tanacetum coccineum]
KNKKYEWGMEQEEAFQTLKSNLYDALILSLPDGVEDFVVYCDASNQGLGCVLIIIYTDHKSLQHIFDQKDLNMRLRRWIELFSDYEYEIRYHLGKVNVVADALRRKERVKLRRVIVDRLTKSAYFLAMREDYSTERLAKLYIDEIVARHRVPMSIITDRDGRFTSCCCIVWKECKSPVLWAEIGESSLIGPELVHETTNKVVLIKEKLKAARDHQKSYVKNRRKLAPRYVGPFEILERIDPVAYRLRLPEELSNVHDTFHVSNLNKCLADANLHVPLDKSKIDKTFHFVEEPVEIMDREVRSLKCSKISLMKVHWNAKRGPDFTW